AIEVLDLVNPGPVLLRGNESQRDRPRLLRRQRLLGQRRQPPVYPRPEHVAGLDVQVARATIHGGLDDPFHRGSARLRGDGGVRRGHVACGRKGRWEGVTSARPTPAAGRSGARRGAWRAAGQSKYTLLISACCASSTLATSNCRAGPRSRISNTRSRGWSYTRVSSTRSPSAASCSRIHSSVVPGVVRMVTLIVRDTRSSRCSIRPRPASTTITVSVAASASNTKPAPAAKPISATTQMVP